MRTLTLHVPGMGCRHCVRAVTACLRDVDGIETVQADATTATVVLTGAVTHEAALGALAECSYRGRCSSTASSCADR
jgi:copper chaperone CopZ